MKNKLKKLTLGLTLIGTLCIAIPINAKTTKDKNTVIELSTKIVLRSSSSSIDPPVINP